MNPLLQPGPLLALSAVALFGGGIIGLVFTPRYHVWPFALITAGFGALVMAAFASGWTNQ